MAEPTGSNLPAAYDDSFTLLGTLWDHRNIALAVEIDAVDTDIETVDSIVDIPVPCYITFETGEIIFCETVGFGGFGWTGVLRGRLGTTGAVHLVDEAMWPALTSKHVTLLRDCLIAAEKYQGLYITKATFGDPLVGASNVALDENLPYFGRFNGVADEWTYVGRTDHDELDGLDEDDHAQYHTEARAVIWHDAIPGEHILDGDLHDHEHGVGAGRFAGGLVAGIPGATLLRQVYYATDTQELYISPDGIAWVKITGAPADAICFFTEAAVTAHGGACPTGWTRYTDLDERFPIGAPDGVVVGLAAVGADTHSHTYSELPIHKHSFLGGAPTCSESGPHSHQYAMSPYAGGSGLYQAQSLSTVYYFSTEDAGSHSHDVNVPERDTEDAQRTDDDEFGFTPGETDVVDNLPPYYTVVFCQKE